MISEHVYALSIAGGASIAPLSGTVTLDESWAPYVQASLTLPLPPADVLAVLDPRTNARARLTLTQRFGSSEPVSAISEDYPDPATVADLSAAWAGLNLSGVSAIYGRPYNAQGTRASTSRRLSLGVRSLRPRYSDGTVELQLASDEARLMDQVNTDGTSRAPATATVRSVVALVLASIGAALQPGDADGPVEADAASGRTGESAWDYANPLVQAAGLRLWCDEHGSWWLTPPLGPTGSSLSFSPSTATEIEESISRDDSVETSGWYDGVHITYRWRDSSDVERVRYDVALMPDASRVLVLTYDRPYPGSGAAAAMLARGRGRGRVLGLEAVSNYDAGPGAPVTVTIPGAPLQTGLATRVLWDMSTDRMQVRTRDLVDTPANAWALVPSGIAWDDVPVGMSWPEFNVDELEG